MANSEQGQTDLGTTSMGLQPNVAAALAYVLTVLTGILFYVIEKENKFVRFHAMQAILLGAAWIVLWIALAILMMMLVFIPFIGWIINAIAYLAVGLGGLVLWLLLIFKAFKGERFKLPVIGDIAEKNS